MARGERTGRNPAETRFCGSITRDIGATPAPRVAWHGQPRDTRQWHRIGRSGARMIVQDVQETQLNKSSGSKNSIFFPKYLLIFDRRAAIGVRCRSTSPVWSPAILKRARAFLIS